MCLGLISISAAYYLCDVGLAIPSVPVYLSIKHHEDEMS